MVKNDDIKQFSGDNILCHYTSMDTALSKILYNRMLKFSYRHLSVDPFESKLSYSVVQQNYPNDEDLYPKVKIAIHKIEKFYNDIKQICFLHK